MPVVAMRKRFDGIADQVDENLLHLNPVDQDLVDARVDGHAHVDAQFLDPDQREGVCLGNQCAQAFDPHFGFATRYEIAQTPHDLPRTHGLFCGIVQCLADNFDVSGVGIGKEVARGLDIIRDRRQRLIEFVRERRRHRAHRTDARDMGKVSL